MSDCAAQATPFPSITLGNPKGPILVFISGFPDDFLTPWTALFDKLKDKYRIVSVCFPQFETGAKFQRWGHDFTELMQMFDATVKHHIQEQPFTLCAFDWGTAIGYKYTAENPSRVQRYVSFDIGFGFGDENFKDIFQSFFYRINFAALYLIACLLGEYIGNICMYLFFILLQMFPFLSPVTEKAPRKIKEVSVRMMYPYFYLMKAIVTNSISMKFPTCPFLYLYGTDKNVMFHNAKFLRRIETTEKCYSKAYNGGHFFMNKFADDVAAELEKFVTSN